MRMLEIKGKSQKVDEKEDGHELVVRADLPSQGTRGMGRTGEWHLHLVNYLGS